tara:strand:+ start:324 stop:497 length:174 start_codon:yes stop_codon:yes gene_type:complete
LIFFSENDYLKKVGLQLQNEVGQLELPKKVKIRAKLLQKIETRYQNKLIKTCETPFE